MFTPPSCVWNHLLNKYASDLLSRAGITNYKTELTLLKVNSNSHHLTTFLLKMQPCIDNLLIVLFTRMSLAMILLFIKSFNLWMLLDHLNSLQFFVLLVMLKILFSMVYVSLLIHPRSYLDTLIWIG